jgi:hypothetical protein
MWMKMVSCIRKVALEELEVTKGGKREAKGAWCNENVKKLLRRRKIALVVYIWIGVWTT